MVVRNYTGDDGQSHFEEIPLAFEVYGGARERTPSQAATGIRFIRWPAGLVYDWHNVPRRQYVILLSGQVELEVGNGTILQIRPGDVTLEEDLTGQGHIVRVVGDQPLLAVVVPLQE